MKPIKPFKLRVDWFLWNIGESRYVTVELSRMDRRFDHTIHRELTPEAAVAWAVKWLADRGFDFYCDVDTHQRLSHTHITLHPHRFPLDPEG